MNTLLLAAGDSALFAQSGHHYPKNLIEIANKPLLQHVIESQPHYCAPWSSLVCLLLRKENRVHHTGEVVRLLCRGARVVEVAEATGGAACTALLAIDTVPPQEPLLVAVGDAVIESDVTEAVSVFTQLDLDGGVIVFESVHPRWSYVRVGELGLAEEFAEKRPISHLATTGYYWFRRADDFWRAIQKMILKDAHVDGRFFIAPSYNELILEGARIGVHRIPVSSYYSLSTPKGVQTFEDRCLAGRSF